LTHATPRTPKRIEKIIKKISKTLVSWASILEVKTLEQARTNTTMPFIYPHLALIPDAHLGLGATVGSAIPTLRAVMPAAAGVDIGCGMIAVLTDRTVNDEARVESPSGVQGPSDS